jgi:putative transposase
MDWHGRAVLSWELSKTLDAGLCIRAVERAMARHGVPEILNTDHGCRFTSAAFTQALRVRGMRIAMDGPGRALDNVLVERLRRTMKYDAVYLKFYLSQVDAHTNLGRFFRFYNDHRPHSAFGDAEPLTPMEMCRRPAALSPPRVGRGLPA